MEIMRKADDVQTDLLQDTFDSYDLNRLCQLIIRQGMDDYIKLQHPSCRTKQYMQEAFVSSVEMFFDDEYRISTLKTDENKPLTIQDIFREALDGSRVDLNKIRRTLVRDAWEFWSKKDLNTLRIPETLIVDGHVYVVLHSETKEEIDFDQKTIYLDKNKGSLSQEKFLKMTIEVLTELSDLKIKVDQLEILSKAIYRMFRMNNCFTGDYPERG